MYDSAIIHLSDLECGDNNRAERPSRVDGYRRCADRLVEDIQRLLFTERELRSDRIGLIITGDIANKGSDAEYEKAAEVVGRIRSRLGIPNRQVAILPGNHDVSRPACEQEFHRQFPHLRGEDEIDRREARGLAEKFVSFNRFCRSTCGYDFGGPESVMLFDGFLTLGVALVALDTSYPCTFHPDDNFGLLRDLAIERAGECLRRAVAGADRPVPVAALHHCLLPFADQIGDDKSYCRNGSEALVWLTEAGFGVVLCGHEHQTKCLGELRTGYRVLATGSYGLNATSLVHRYSGAARADSNKYQILLVQKDETSSLLFRRLRTPGGFDDSWGPDDSDGGAAIYLRLPRRYLGGTSEQERLTQQANLLVAGPSRMRSGRLMITMSLRAPRDTLGMINVVSYRVGDRGPLIESRNREDGFLRDEEVVSGNSICVQAWFETDLGRLGPLVVEIPGREVALAAH